ncbi:hypothetical protein EHQ81_07380 [Leptospira selangorensis]|uniref:Uncharacterized protein n=1 Tax=Leptospira selangorensis TaxID=2484982 RepID=A0A5F2C1X0_9LEPT|nr:hypothetical protein [Leptospira selangorensis]TGM16197.1 hypothetical protein EHQ81_07380 [Leptospira selangorensis]TGM17853.1 hypothetical protein EHQ82_12325 [Leptospira selangorensis]
MPRIFRPNAYFEEELRLGKLFPRELEARNSVLESSFSVLNSFPDSAKVLAHSPPEENWIKYWQEKGVQIPKPILLRNIKQSLQKEKEIQLEEWGKISRWNSNNSELEIDTLLADSAKKFGSKLNQNDWNQESNPDLISYSIRNSKDWEVFLQKEKDRFSPDQKFVFKTEFGFAGAQKFRDVSGLKDLAYLFLKVKREPFLIETWVDRTKDFSLLFSAKKGEYKIEEGTILLNDHKGKYSGTWMGEFSEIQNYLSEMSENFSQVSKFHPSYEGYGSVDSFFYKSEGTQVLRKISEVNFRWTMGCLLLELRHRFPKKGNDLLLFLPKVQNSDPYSRLKIWEKETGWEIFPLSAFFSPYRRPNQKNLIWVRLPAGKTQDPWEEAKIVSESGIRALGP